jgi:sugar lactone lactonase YvrE
MSKRLFTLIYTFFIAMLCHAQQGGIITTVAGAGYGYSGDDSAAVLAKLRFPSGVAIDRAGNIYIADQGNFAIRKVNAAGIITTISGNDTTGYAGDGLPAKYAEFSYPSGLAVDGFGNLFIADTRNNVIRRISAAGIITTYAGNGTQGYTGDGSLAIYASIYSPSGIAADAAGNLFIADQHNNVVRKVDTKWIITTVAGGTTSGYSGDNGPATLAGLKLPSAVAVDGAGNLYIADMGNYVVRKVDPSGIITTVAGVVGSTGYTGDGGPATAATLGTTTSIAADVAGNVYIAAAALVRKVDPSGIITTAAGNDTMGYTGSGVPAIAAKIGRQPYLATDASGNIFIADKTANIVRKITSSLSVGPVGSSNTGIAIIPNPNNGSFTISGAVRSIINEQAPLIITDITGTVVYKDKVLLQNGNIHTQITLPNELPNGVYVLRVQSSKEGVVSRVVIDK